MIGANDYFINGQNGEIYAFDIFHTFLTEEIPVRINGVEYRTLALIGITKFPVKNKTTEVILFTGTKEEVNKRYNEIKERLEII